MLIELLKYFLYAGATTFGGPLAIIETFRKDLALKKNWVTTSEFENYLGYSQIAPGPLAFQVALYIGYFKEGFLGALLSGFGLVFPSFILVLAFSMFYNAYKDISIVIFALYGLRPLITAIIFQSGYNLSKSVFKKDYFLYTLFILSILISIFLKIHILWLILSFSIISLVFYSIKEKKFGRLNFFTGFLLFPIIIEFISSLKELFNDKLIQIAVVFLKAGALTYGSGFVIVGVLGQEVVEKMGWLTSQQFLDGIAFGQITPGPVVITSTFIGYITCGFWGAIIATLCIFTPTFIIVMTIASKVGKFKDNFYVKSLIKGANAAAIGAILSTAFALSKDSIIDYSTLAIFLISLAILVFSKFKPIYLILISSAAGIIIKLLIA